MSTHQYHAVHLTCSRLPAQRIIVESCSILAHDEILSNFLTEVKQRLARLVFPHASGFLNHRHERHLGMNKEVKEIRTTIINYLAELVWLVTEIWFKHTHARF